MADKFNAPEIRFAEFADPWKQRKLGEFLSESRERGNSGKGARKLTVKLWGKGVVEKKDFGGSERTQYYRRKSGQFIYSKLDFLNAAFGVIPDKLNGFESTLDLPAFDIEKLNPYFLYYKTIQKDFYLKYGTVADGSRKAKRIHSDTFLEMPICAPNQEEQHAIVAFLQRLDSLITLHQRKHDSLCSVKKSMLLKMFPRDSATVPEIRFAGFADPWKQSKLGEVATFSKGVGYSKADISKTGTPFIHYGRLYTDYETAICKVETFAHQTQGSVISNGTEVVTPSSGETAEDIAIASAIISSDIILGSGLNIIHPASSLDPIFLALSISYGRQHLELTKKAQGKSVVHLYINDLSDSLLLYPSVEEQKHIGSFFRQLDKIITLHQRELNLLKKVKHSMLQKMFV